MWTIPTEEMPLHFVYTLHTRSEIFGHIFSNFVHATEFLSAECSTCGITSALKKFQTLEHSAVQSWGLRMCHLHYVGAEMNGGKDYLFHFKEDLKDQVFNKYLLSKWLDRCEYIFLKTDQDISNNFSHIVRCFISMCFAYYSTETPNLVETHFLLFSLTCKLKQLFI